MGPAGYTGCTSLDPLPECADPRGDHDVLVADASVDHPSSDWLSEAGLGRERARMRTIICAEMSTSRARNETIRLPATPTAIPPMVTARGSPNCCPFPVRRSNNC